MTLKRDMLKLRRKADSWDRNMRVEFDKKGGKGHRQDMKGQMSNPTRRRNKQLAEFKQSHYWLSDQDATDLFNQKNGFDIAPGNGSDTQFAEFKRYIGGNPFKTQMQQLKGGRNTGGANPALARIATLQQQLTQMGNAKDGPSMLDSFLADAQQKSDQRETDDREREATILQNREGLRDRTLGGMRRGGTRAQAALDQQLVDRQGEIEASYASNGMDMSTGGDAQSERAKYNNMLLQGDLSDRLDDRMIKADVDLTERVEGFRERPTYNGPDMGQLMQLAQAQGRGNDGQGFQNDQMSSMRNELAQLQQSLSRPRQSGGGGGGSAFPAGGGVSAAGAARMQQNMGGMFNGVGGATGGFQGVWRPNNYQSQRPQENDPNRVNEAGYQQQHEQQQRDAREAQRRSMMTSPPHAATPGSGIPNAYTPPRRGPGSPPAEQATGGFPVRPDIVDINSRYPTTPGGWREYDGINTVPKDWTAMDRGALGPDTYGRFPGPVEKAMSGVWRDPNPPAAYQGEPWKPEPMTPEELAAQSAAISRFPESVPPPVLAPGPRNNLGNLIYQR
jgi:hypothetical protein